MTDVVTLTLPSRVAVRLRADLVDGADGVEQGRRDDEARGLSFTPDELAHISEMAASRRAFAEQLPTDPDAPGSFVLQLSRDADDAVLQVALDLVFESGAELAVRVLPEPPSREHIVSRANGAYLARSDRGSDPGGPEYDHYAESDALVELVIGWLCAARQHGDDRDVYFALSDMDAEAVLLVGARACIELDELGWRPDSDADGS